MIQIKNLDNNDKKIIEQIVKIHMETFEGFFLTFMGKGFLKQMYSSYVQHDKSNILVAIDENVVVGFLAYSEDMSGLYKHMIKRRLIPFAWYSLGAFFRKPKVFIRLIRAFLKPSESIRTENYIELASIGVNPQTKGQGIGTKLIEHLKGNVDFSAFEYITLETDVENNEYANKFYQKNGFNVEREFETREGRKMYEYRYTKEKKD